MADGRRRRYMRQLLLLGALSIWAFTAIAVLGRGFNFDGLAQLGLKRYGPSTQQTVERWRDLLNSLHDAPDTEKTRRVNDFFNRRITFSEDIAIWGQSDYWATPLEIMGRGEGDCEDFAIAKYFSLLILGVPADNLRITYVKARIGGPRSTVSQAHMVLGYYPNPVDEPMILDNLLNDIRPASRRPDLTPVFSFNSDGLWVGTTPGGASSGSSTARLSRWRDLLSRMKADGFE
jgi:predicted transglutaminase-like cysteine proteinase